MTACLKKSCSFGLLCVFFVNVCRFVCVLLSLLVGNCGWEIPDHCLSLYFDRSGLILKPREETNFFESKPYLGRVSSSEAIEDLTFVLIFYEIYAFGELHKFHMKFPRV